MRRALFATAGMNVAAAMAFLPGASTARALAGFPEEAPSFYLATVGMFVLLFGLGYLWAALLGRADRLFVGVSALGKISFFALVLGFWLAGDLPPRAPALAAADLGFGALFLAWLFGGDEKRV